MVTLVLVHEDLMNGVDKKGWDDNLDLRISKVKNKPTLSVTAGSLSPLGNSGLTKVNFSDPAVSSTWIKILFPTTTNRNFVTPLEL